MDNAAYLRIKFTPLLKKVSSENIVSKCCIEIVPELSDTQNLDKIDWKIDKDLVEYNIPMMYKIIIKNPNPNTHEFSNKVYHSCVDLLPDSMSNTNLASGDVKHIKSDNLFILKSYSCDEKYEAIPTKALLRNNERNRHKTTSHHQLGEDKCLEADILNNTEPVVRVSKSEETLKADIDKYDNSTNTFDLFNTSPNNVAKKISTESLNAYIESFNEKYSQRKLSLSPICSVNTWDTFPAGPIYMTNNTSSYTFSKVINKDKSNDTGYNSSPKNYSDGDKNKNMPYSESGPKLRLFETNRNVYSIQMIDDTRIDNENVRKMDGKGALTQRYARDITTSISRITITGYGIEKSRNNLKIRNVYKSVDLSMGRKLKNNVNFEQLNAIFRNDTLNAALNKDKNVTGLKMNPPEKRCLARATPAIRVARFVKCMEEEIYPLKQMLYEIRSKCACLGLDLFGSEIVPPEQKSVIYRPVSNFEYIVDESGNQQNNSTKSNRVVYTVLFNG